MVKFRQKWKEELELKQQVRSAGPSLNSTPDHTLPTQRKDKEDEVGDIKSCRDESACLHTCSQVQIFGVSYRIYVHISCSESCDFASVIW